MPVFFQNMYFVVIFSVNFPTPCARSILQLFCNNLNSLPMQNIFLTIITGFFFGNTSSIIILAILYYKISNLYENEIMRLFSNPNYCCQHNSEMKVDAKICLDEGCNDIASAHFSRIFVNLNILLYIRKCLFVLN